MVAEGTLKKLRQIKLRVPNIHNNFLNSICFCVANYSLQTRQLQRFERDHMQSRRFAALESASQSVSLIKLGAIIWQL